MIALKPIVFLSSEFPPQPGGIGWQAHGLAKAWSENGIPVTVLTNSREAPEDECRFDSHLPFHVIRVPRSKILAKTYLERVQKALAALSREGQPKLLLASGKFSLWTGALAKHWTPQNRVIGILHGSELNLGGWAGQFTRLALSQIPECIAVSHFTRQKALDKGASQAVVIPNGFDPARFVRPDEMKRLKGHPALVTVGGLHARKGQHNLIRALPAIRKVFPEAHYHMAGIPTEARAMQDLASKLNVEASITIHGILPEKKLAAFLYGADLFVMLSENQPNGDVEGFGMATLEANHCGLPALGSIGTGTAESICNGFSGRLVDPRNAKHIVEAIQDLMDHHDQYRDKARMWSVHFHWEKIAQRYLDYFYFP